MAEASLVSQAVETARSSLDGLSMFVERNTGVGE